MAGVLSYDQKLLLLIEMRLSPPNAEVAKARKDIADAMIKETPELAVDLERFEQGLKAWQGCGKADLSVVDLLLFAVNDSVTLEGLEKRKE